MCLDALLKILLWCGIPTQLEADGSISLYVRYLYHVYTTCNLSPSILLTAIREGAISVWSEEGGCLLTGNYNWDLVQHCQDMKKLGMVGEGDDEEDWGEDEPVIIIPYSHSEKDSFENGLDVVDVVTSLQSEPCDCDDDAFHSKECHLAGTVTVREKNEINETRSELINGDGIHGSFPDIIKSTSLPRNTTHRPHESLVENVECRPTIEDSFSTSEDASVKNDDSSSTLDLGDDGDSEEMNTKSDDMLSNHELTTPSLSSTSQDVPTNNIPKPLVDTPRSQSSSEEIELVDKSLQTSGSYLQNLPETPVAAPIPTPPPSSPLEIEVVDISMQTNRSYLQNIPGPPSTSSKSQSTVEVEVHLIESHVLGNGIVCDDDTSNTKSLQSLNRNPLGKTSSVCSSTSSEPSHHSPHGSTMSISSSLCREYDNLLTDFIGDADSDTASLQSQHSTLCSSGRNSDVLTVSDILAMSVDSKHCHDNGLQDPDTSWLSNLDTTIDTSSQDETSQSLDDAISDISETDYQSDFSDTDTLSTTSGEISLCNGYPRGESPNIEIMLGSFNRTDSFSESQDTDDLPDGQIFQPRKSVDDNDQSINGHGSIGIPLLERTKTNVNGMKCTCSNTGGSQRRYLKKNETNLACSCSRKSRAHRLMDSKRYCRTMNNGVSIYNDNNNNGDLILIDDAIRGKDLGVDIDVEQDRSPENVLRKISQRLSSLEEFDFSDTISTTSSESSVSSASTVVEVAPNGKVCANGDKLSLLQFEDMFSPDEYDAFKNDLMWRWYNSKDESTTPRSHHTTSNGKDVGVEETPITSESLEKDIEILEKDIDRMMACGTAVAGGTEEDYPPVKEPITRQSSVLSNPDDDDVFLPDVDDKINKMDAIDEMIQNLCAMVNGDAMMSDPITPAARKARTLDPSALRRSNLRKDLELNGGREVKHAKSAWNLQSGERATSPRNVRFAEVDDSRVAVVSPVMKDGSLQRSCLKKSATIASPYSSMSDMKSMESAHQPPSIVQKFYQRKYGRHHVKNDSILSHLSKSSPHLATAPTSSYIPKYANPPAYRVVRRQQAEHTAFSGSNYERSQSVTNISQAGQMGEPTKRCDPAVLLYGTYRPPQRSKRTVSEAQPPAPPLPRPPSYEQHLQKYGLPRFLHSSKNRNVEIPPSPIMAQFSSDRRKRCVDQPAVVRRREKKGMKLEPGGKNRHSTGSYIGMSEQQMDRDLTQDWLDDGKNARGQQSGRGQRSSGGSSNEEDEDRRGSPLGQKSKLKDRMIYFLLNL